MRRQTERIYYLPTRISSLSDLETITHYTLPKQISRPYADSKIFNRNLISHKYHISHVSNYFRRMDYYRSFDIYRTHLFKEQDLLVRTSKMYIIFTH